MLLNLLLLLVPLLGPGLGVHVVHPDVYDDDACGIYPPCSQYGEGAWEILEDCHRYINCTQNANGVIEQHNMECPGDLVYANEYGECVEWDKATQCKVFQETPCLGNCPRVYLGSTGPAAQYRERMIGCFRISGTLFGGTMVHYMNRNREYLTPDSMSNPFKISWIISESPGAFNGLIRNNKYDYIRCPMDDWNQGWEVDVGGGVWVEDDTMKLKCHRGDEGATTNFPPLNTTTTSHQPVSRCHKDGPLATGDCVSDFLCCEFDETTDTWGETSCTCTNGNVYSQEFNYCTWPVACSKKDDLSLLVESQDMYTCEGGVTCPGYGD